MNLAPIFKSLIHLNFPWKWFPKPQWYWWHLITMRMSVCVCDHHEFREVGPWNKVNHLFMGRSHDHLCKWSRVQLPKIEHVLKGYQSQLQMGVTCQVVASLSLYILKKTLNNFCFPFITEKKGTMPLKVKRTSQHCT